GRGGFGPGQFGRGKFGKGKFGRGPGPFGGFRRGERPENTKTHGRKRRGGPEKEPAEQAKEGPQKTAICGRHGTTLVTRRATAHPATSLAGKDVPMRSPSACALSLLFACAVALTAAEEKEARAPDLTGTWSYVSGVRAGKTVAKERMSGKVTITKDTITISTG